MTDTFNIHIIDIVDGDIVVLSDKLLYNTDNLEQASEWVYPKTKHKNNNEINTLKSALIIGSKTLKTNNEVIAWFTNGNNNVNYNIQEVYLMCCPNDRGKSNVPVYSDNFTRCVSLFAARKLIDCDWINSKDEYLAPNEQHEKYQEFTLDSAVYSLFHVSSNQSSLRQVDYKGKKWDIKNEFFWMSKDEMLELANSNNNDFCYSDARTSEDRYVYKYIKEHNGEFSEEAQAVLDKACELVRKSFKYRALFDEEHTEYQINNWDCGWYQIKALVKEYLPEDYKAFHELYKKLADKMRPMVYELGFLK